MTERPDFRPRWAIKLGRDTKIDPEIRALYKVGAVVIAALIIWTIVARL